jgi:hypothetical protein
VRSGWLRLIPAFIVSTLLIPSAAFSQSTTPAPEAAMKDPAFDAAGYIAWFRANRGGIGGQTFRDWFSTARLSLSIGRYWTEHLKTEAELAITGHGNLVSFEEVESEPSVTRSLYRDHTYEVRTLSVLQAWQFGHNAWVHPFVGGGVDIDWERRTTKGSVQVIDSRTDPARFTSESLPRDRHTEVIARPIAMVGLKAYLARNAFFRTDVRASFREGIDNVVWRLGFGCDF